MTVFVPLTQEHLACGYLFVRTADNPAALLPLIENRPRDGWFKQINAWKTQYPFKYFDDTANMKPQAVIDAVGRVAAGGSALDPEVVGRMLGRRRRSGPLDELSPRERDVLAMRYGADMTAAEIGRALDLTEANVHQINSRALRRLRQLLTERPELLGNA